MSSREDESYDGTSSNRSSRVLGLLHLDNEGPMRSDFSCNQTLCFGKIIVQRAVRESSEKLRESLCNRSGDKQDSQASRSPYARIDLVDGRSQTSCICAASSSAHSGLCTAYLLLLEIVP